MTCLQSFILIAVATYALLVHISRRIIINGQWRVPQAQILLMPDRASAIYQSYSCNLSLISDRSLCQKACPRAQTAYSAWAPLRIENASCDGRVVRVQSKISRVDTLEAYIAHKSFGDKDCRQYSTVTSDQAAQATFKVRIVIMIMVSLDSHAMFMLK